MFSTAVRLQKQALNVGNRKLFIYGFIFTIHYSINKQQVITSKQLNLNHAPQRRFLH